MIKIDKLIRSKRKTIQIEINSSAELIIRSPLNVNLNEINKFIFEKSKWILEKQKEIKSKNLLKPSRKYIEDEEFLYLGKLYSLKINDNQKNILVIDDENIYLDSKYKSIAFKVFESWYKKNAKKVLIQRTISLSHIMNLYPSDVKISSAKTRWGSCSPTNSINLNWRLIMAPIQIIDYLIIHELAHIKHKNHSSEFWKTVSLFDVNYKKNRNWLKENGYLLSLE